MNVKIGINPISWSNDDLPTLGGETPLEVALTEGKRIGYQGFELGNKFPREAQALRRVLAPYGLALVSGWYSGRLAHHCVSEEIAAVAQHLTLLAEGGAGVMVYGEVAASIQGANVPLYKRPRFIHAQQWREYGRRVTDFARYTLDHGVRLAYHHHMGAYVETPDDVDRLMGGPGNDLIGVSSGADVVYAGPGSDTVKLIDDGVADRVDCGLGADKVQYFSPLDPRDVLVGCEHVGVVG